MDTNRAIAVLSFNRPDYLEQVLRSISISVNRSGLEFDIYLFQDGNYNPKSHTNKCIDDEIDGCIRIFQSQFPRGRVMRSPINIGVALNFFRAEEFLLILRKYNSAMIFEDDLVVHPYYITVLGAMLDVAEITEQIGQVACYGDNHLLPVSEQLASVTKLTGLGNNWGCGISRRFYLRRRERDRPYIELISGIDYSHKDALSDKIHQLHENQGFSPGVLSQDMFKTMTTYSQGGLRLNTAAVLGFYIGKQGLHSTHVEYDAANFGDTVLYPTDGPIPNPDFSILQTYDEELERQRSLVRDMRPRA